MALPVAQLRRLTSCLTGIVLCGGVAASPALALDTQLVESGFSSPIFMTAPDGDPRLFVVERDGCMATEFSMARR